MTPYKKLIELWRKVIGKPKVDKPDFHNSTSYKNLLSRPIAATVSEEDLYHAYELLIYDGEHQWHLNSAYIENRDEALELLIQDRLWDKDFSTSTFEDIFQHVKKLLVKDGKRLNGITQLTWYDISLRLVMNNNEKWKCYPDKVYVHALPGYVSKRILDIHYPGQKQKTCDIIDSSVFAPLFPDLEPMKVEWILCEIGKAIRQFNKTGQPRNGKWQKFDEEVIRLIKDAKI